MRAKKELAKSVLKVLKKWEKRKKSRLMWEVRKYRSKRNEREKERCY